MKVILYQYPGSSDLPSVSPPCLKVSMALRYLEVEHEVIDLRRPGQIKRVSRTGRLPVAEIDGRLVPDSIEIMDALESRHPGLRPADPRRALQDRLWEHFVNDYVYFMGYYLRWVAYRDRTLAAMFGRAPRLVRLTARYVLARRGGRRAGCHSIGLQDEATVLRFIERAFSMLSDGLEGGPYLQGRATPARGDLAAASMLAQVGWRDSMPPVVERLGPHPALREHTARVFEACGMSRPHWLRAGRREKT